MSDSNYVIKEHKIKGYTAFYLLVRLPGLFGIKRWRYIPTLFKTMRGVGNNYSTTRRLPARINKKNFFYFIHAQDPANLKEFIREYPKIEMYLDKLNHYLGSVKYNK